MDKLTSFKSRKIVNTCLIILTLIFTFLGFVLKNKEFNMIYFELLFAKVLDNLPLGCAAALGVFLILILILLFIALPKVLIQNSLAYFRFQAVITICLFLMIIINYISKVLPSGAYITMAIALIINILATVYYVLCYKYHKEEMIISERPKEDEDNNENMTTNAVFADEPAVLENNVVEQKSTEIKGDN